MKSSLLALLALASAITCLADDDQFEPGRWSWSNRARFYADDWELENPYQYGQTFLGVQFDTHLTFETSQVTAFDFGVLGQHDFGNVPMVQPVYPLLSLRVELDEVLGGKFRAAFGSLDRRTRFVLVEPLFDTRFMYTRTVEYGFQNVFTHDFVDAQIFLDWQKLAQPGEEERLDYGGSFAIKPWAPLQFETQFHGVHRGGPFQRDVPTANNLAIAAGPRGKVALPAELDLGWRLLGAWSMDQFYLGKQGVGAYLGIDLTWKEVWSLSLRGFAGQDFYALEGLPIYQALSESLLTSRQYIDYQGIQMKRRFVFPGQNSGDLSIWIHRVQGTVDYSFVMNWELGWKKIIGSS